MSPSVISLKEFLLCLIDGWHQITSPARMNTFPKSLDSPRPKPCSATTNPNNYTESGLIGLCGEAARKIQSPTTIQKMVSYDSYWRLLPLCSFTNSPSAGMRPYSHCFLLAILLGILDVLLHWGCCKCGGRGVLPDQQQPGCNSDSFRRNWQLKLVKYTVLPQEVWKQHSASLQHGAARFWNAGGPEMASCTGWIGKESIFAVLSESRYLPKSNIIGQNLSKWKIPVVRKIEPLNPTLLVCIVYREDWRHVQTLTN